MIRRLPAIWACLWCAVACAQPPAETAPQTPAPIDQPASQEPAQDSPDSVFVRDQDGRWVIADDTVESSGALDSGSQALVPPAYIAQLQIDGQVDGDFADLSAQIRVEITRSNDWYELPLALDQARIYDWEYSAADAASGAGTSAPAPAVPGNRETGIRWLFQGIGTHRLTLKFRLPVKSTTAGRQLQLTLPTLPTNYVTRAVLRIPSAHVVTTEPPANVTLRSRVLESGETELQSDIAGTRWDLGWRLASGDEPSFAKVVTRFLVRRDAGPLRMVATQECEVEQGSVAEITARLPTNFALESVELGGQQRSELAYELLNDRPGWVRVTLGAELQGSFELEWRLTAPFPPGGGTVLIDGLELADARRQQGTIEIETVDGYTARYVEANSAGVQRVDVGDFKTGEPVDEFRFQFQRQPWQLEYSLRPVEAGADAASETFLLIDAGRNAQSSGDFRADLYLDVQLHVFRGQVQELVIDWPNYAAAGWSPSFTRADVFVDNAIEPETAMLDVDALSANPDQLRLQLSRPCSDTLRTLLHFTRMAAPSDSLELNIPQPVATRAAAPTLTLASAVNLETTVAADGIASEPRDRPLPADLPPQFAGRSARTYELPANPAPVRVEWSEQKRTISAETALSVETVRSSVIQVTQEITYDVSYGYVNALLIEAPAPANETPSANGLGRDSAMHFFLDGRELTAELRDNLWRVELPDRIGRFVVSIEHLLPAPADLPESDRLFTVPILQAVDAPFETTIIRLNSLRLAPQETGWRTWLTASHENAWSTTTPRSYVQLQIDDEARQLPQKFTVDTAFIRTWFGEPGQANVYGEYAIRDAGQTVVVTLPSAAVNQEFRWDGQPLSATDRVRADKDAPGRFLVRLAATDDESVSGRLTVSYRTPQPSNPSLVSAYETEFPRFDEDVVVNSTYWEVVLTPGMQLSLPPADMVPQYTWERDTVLWTRRPTADYLALREQFARYESTAAPALPRGNTYAYSAVGAVSRGAVGAMARSLIVLIGAGFSLLLGFVFRRIPATRNLLSVLVLGFLGTLAGLWCLELVQLLLQPAVLGLLLAAVAASFDIARHDRRRGRRESTIERPPSHSGRRAAATPRIPALPAHTAVFHPDSASGSGRGT